MAEQILKHKQEEIQLVIFKLGSEEYGVDINDVREIIKKEKITPVPSAPTFIEGIINLRGKIVVVMNLLKRFGTFDEQEHKGTHIVISEINNSNFGILVDDVLEVLKINKDNIKKAPGIIASKIHLDHLKGVGIIGERLLILLDLQKVFAEKELIEMAQTTKEMKGEVVEKFTQQHKEVASTTFQHNKKDSVPTKQEIVEVLGKNKQSQKTTKISSIQKRKNDFPTKKED